MKKQSLTLLLVATILSTFGCQNTQGEEIVTSDNYRDNIENTTTTPIDTTVSDDLPSDLDFQGRELRILTTNNTNHAPILVEEETGDILSDALYERNSKIMERFGITITEETEAWNDARDKARRFITAGSDEYDLVSLIDREALTFASEGMLWYAEDVENTDLSKPYWNQYLNSCITIGGKQVLALSDMGLTSYDFTHIMLFNTALVDDLKITSPYDLVENGTWTLDKFQEYALLASNDLNGDSIYDKNDQYGFTSYVKQIAPCFWVGSGCLSIEKNQDDIPEFTMANERMLNVLQKAYDLTYGGTLWYVQSAEDYTSGSELFTNGHSFFANSTVGTLFGADYRNMKDDYGVIPYPKYDEEQEAYYSRVEGSSIYFIPKTVEDTSFAGAVMEAMSCESYNSVIPVFYEIALKAKYIRDSQSGAIIDMLMENRIYDWGDTFFTNYIRDGFVFWAFADGKNVAASDIESNRTAVETAIKNIVDKLADE